MRGFLLVGAGGLFGSMARYYVSGLVTRATASGRFPAGTLVVNLVGCLIIGVLGGLAEQLSTFSPAARLFLFTGVLGGFTTYSAFAFETTYLGRSNLWGLALANVAAHVVLGLGAVWVGRAVVVAIVK